MRNGNYFLLILLLPIGVLAQDYTNIDYNDSLSFKENLKQNSSVHGGIGTSFTAYQAWGGFSRRDPYNYSAFGNFTVKSYEVELPFSFYITNQNTDFRQPFNQFGVSPKYKWATAHLGYRNLNWSNFSMAGHTFLGAGIELNPGILRFGFAYGRFRQAVEINNVDGLIPSYRRMGYAVKVGVNTKKGFVDVIAMRGKDDINSVSSNIDSSGVTPGENLVLAITGQQKLNKQISVNFEIARSAYTEDIRANATELSGSNRVYGNFGNVFSPNASSSYNNAYQASINFTPKKVQTSLKYRRVEGDFKSMGAYFFNNDLEDVTVNLATSFFKSKVTFNGSFGLQRNNLTETEASQTIRTIGSANIFWMASKQLNFGLNYSNYTSTLSSVRDLVTDSINFYQVSNTYNFTANYNFGSDDVAQSISLNLGFQEANARSEYNISDVITSFRNANLNYRTKFKGKGLGFKGGINYTEINSPGNELINIGPIVGISKELFNKKLSLKLSDNVLQQIANQSKQSLVNIIRLSANYRPLKKHSFALIATHLNRTTQSNRGNDFAELRGTIRYQYSF